MSSMIYNISSLALDSLRKMSLLFPSNCQLSISCQKADFDKLCSIKPLIVERQSPCSCIGGDDPLDCQDLPNSLLKRIRASSDWHFLKLKFFSAGSTSRHMVMTLKLLSPKSSVVILLKPSSLNSALAWDLALEFDCTIQTIHKWKNQANRPLSDCRH